ncbi:LuxR family transcriptional regulator [Enterobacter asburiae]|uniref:LuxR family transcriptional regulator n=1 Tax=unclassified Scandinavium TaxID=2830652 RepID=UPI00289EC0C2|nr:LuxR family transcriptional regulator [Scandinavium sp.]
MMRGEDYTQHDHADIWLTDNYLRMGLENILQKIKFDNTGLRYVFLTEHHYTDVLKHNYDLTKNRIVLLTEGTSFNFLNTAPFYQLPKRVTVHELQNFVISISYLADKPLESKKPVLLTARERRLIDLIKEGKKMAEMGEYLNLHIKTVYQTRQTLIKKIGCSGAIDLLRTLRSDIFKNWLMESHQYH